MERMYDWFHCLSPAADGMFCHVFGFNLTLSKRGPATLEPFDPSDRAYLLVRWSFSGFGDSCLFRH